MEREVTFYLASADSSPALAPRRCFFEERHAAIEERDDYLRIRIEPPIVGQPYGLGEHNINDVILATRHAGTTLHPVSEWPMMVFVCRIINEQIRHSGKASANDLEMILIGELYRTWNEANESISHEERHI
ncbi:MAG: hypothetical protein KKA73_20095 [Chloroflexi bacterium]|nr:hypothetical protein [Chloroflexota bacterium]MBU1749991.1 hypothetical protein [Chloroflexota bacterium]MBU1878002.1 hypothetical protein [Chloroflexota bacterium]